MDLAGFKERGKLGNLEKKHQSREKNEKTEQQTQYTYSINCEIQTCMGPIVGKLYIMTTLNLEFKFPPSSPKWTQENN